MRKAGGKRVGEGNRCHEVYIFTYIDHKYAVQYCCQDEGFFSAFFLVFFFFCWCCVPHYFNFSASLSVRHEQLNYFSTWKKTRGGHLPISPVPPHDHRRNSEPENPVGIPLLINASPKTGKKSLKKGNKRGLEKKICYKSCTT